MFAYLLHKLKKSELIICLCAVICLFLCFIIPSRFVYRAEGPYFNVLGYVTFSGESEAVKVLDISGVDIYKTTGAIYMLTVSLYGTPTNPPSVVETFFAWLSKNKTVLPMDGVYAPEVSYEKEVEESRASFSKSQSTAFELALNMLGISSEEADISIALEDIGGTSAGLAFSLGIIDLLSEEDILGGLELAATGTISADGTVGAIGGVKQKLLTTISSGAKYMLIPSDNCQALKGENRKGVSVISVDNIYDALKSIELINLHQTHLLNICKA